LNLSDQIKALVAKMAAQVEKRDAMVVKSATEGTALTAEQFTEIDGINDALAADQKQLDALKATEKSIAARAVAVPAAEPATKVADGSRIEVKSNLPKGSLFTRVAMLQAKSRGDMFAFKSLAEANYRDDDAVQTFVKSAVAAGNTNVAAWAGNLIYPQEYTADFIELLYPQTVLGRLSVRKVPFNVTIAGQTGGTSVGWVGEGAPAPVTKAAFNRIYLTHTKVAALSVLSDELIRFSNPAAEALVQADLLKACAKGLDLTFMGAAAAVPNVSPAGMLNGVTTVPASGTTPLAVIKDVQALIKPFIDLNYDVSSAVIVMTPGLALQIGSLRSALGAKYFPNIDMTGGVLEGIRVMASNNAPAGTMTLFIQDEIYLSEDAAPAIDLSREASIIMDDAPGAATSTPVSMFQNGMVAVRIEQMINWQLRRTTGAAGQITGCAYVSDQVVQTASA
jgi:HK97 family phage major capsid protein